MALDENGLIYHSCKYGVTIITPPGAVDQKCTLQFGACLTFPHFRSKDSWGVKRQVNDICDVNLYMTTVNYTTGEYTLLLKNQTKH